MRNTTIFLDEYYLQLEGAFIKRYGGINEEGFPVFEIFFYYKTKFMTKFKTYF